jgi:hypothetical protein
MKKKLSDEQFLYGFAGILMLALTGYFLWAVYNPDVKRVSSQRTQEFSVRESNFIEKFKPVAFEGVILQIKKFTRIRGDRNYLMKIALKPVDSLQYDFESILIAIRFAKSKCLLS